MRNWSKFRWVMTGGVLWAVLILVVIYFKVIEPEDFFSSPTSTRDLHRFKGESSVGILKEVDWEIDEARPAGVPMAAPERLEGVDDDFILNWKGEAAVKAQRQKENWASGLLGDDAIDLVAFATWVPQANDELDDESALKINPVFRDAATLKKLTAGEMKKLGIPDSFQTMTSTTKYPSGKMRLIFRTSTMDYVHFVKIDGGNAATRARVTYDLEELGEDEPNQNKIGEWAFYDAALVTWHDAPVNFNAVILTGEPIRKPLEQKLGAQVVFSDLLRMQWLAAVDGTVSDETNSFQDFATAAGLNEKQAASLFATPDPAAEKEAITLGDFEFSHPATEGSAFEKLIEKTETAQNGGTPVVPDPELSLFSNYDHWAYLSVEEAKRLVPEWGDFLAKHATLPKPIPENSESAMWIKVNQPDYDWFPRTLVRISSAEYRNHCGWVREDGSIEWRWNDEEKENDLDIHSTRQMVNMSKPLELVFLPKMAPLKFEIGGMPDLPNSADLPDLFDVEFPRITLPENTETAEDRLLQVVGVATQNGWDIENKWKKAAPKEFPADRTFRNVSAQELLNWYVKYTPGSKIDYDKEGQVLAFNQEEVSLWDKTKAFFSEMLEKISI